MLTAETIRSQVERLTADLVGLSLCNHQNFPALRDLGNGIKEICLSTQCNMSVSLRNIAYREVYDELDRTQTYNIKMIDGALLQMMYRFKGDSVVAHRLAFFPSPYLEEFQNNPEIYLEDEIYAEVVMKNIVPFPIRFDYDSDDTVVKELDHPKSHLTLGQYKNCRIPVSAPLTPYHFISFVLRNFYNTAFKKYCGTLTVFEDSFSETLEEVEKTVVHVRTP